MEAPLFRAEARLLADLGCAVVAEVHPGAVGATEDGVLAPLGARGYRVTGRREKPGHGTGVVRLRAPT